jgi:hypothetical protein
MSIANRVPTPIVDKNGKATTVHRSTDKPNMKDIKNRIKSATPPRAAEAVLEQTFDADGENLDRASLPVQEYTITADNSAKFEHIIKMANNRLERAGVEDRFEYGFESKVIHNENDGTSREVIVATLNKPTISNGEWTFTATHEFTPAGDVLSYYGKGADFEVPEDAHCDQCHTNRRRERIYTVTNPEGDTKQIGSNCLQLFMGVRPEGLWTLNDTKIEDSLSDLESSSLGSNSGVSYSLRDVVGVALNLTNDGANYISRANSTMATKATADEVSLALSEKDKKYDAAKVDDVIAYVRSTSNNGSDYIDNLKSVFGSGNNTDMELVKARHVGIAASAVSAWYRENNKPSDIAKEGKPPVNQEWIGTPGDKIIKPMKLTLEFRATYPTDYGDKTTMIFRDEDNHLIKWGASNPPEVWEGGVIDISKLTIKEHSTYNDDKQTSIIRPTVKNVESAGKAPEWKVWSMVQESLTPEMSQEDKQAVLKSFDDLESIEEKREFAQTRLTKQSS